MGELRAPRPSRIGGVAYCPRVSDFNEEFVIVNARLCIYNQKFCWVNDPCLNVRNFSRNVLNGIN